jgi:hypothetical protein
MNTTGTTSWAETRQTIKHYSIINPNRNQETAEKAFTLLSKLTTTIPPKTTITPQTQELNLTWIHHTTTIFTNITLTFKPTGGYEFYYYHKNTTNPNHIYTEDNSVAGINTHYRKQNPQNTHEKLTLIADKINTLLP